MARLVFVLFIGFIAIAGYRHFHRGPNQNQIRTVNANGEAISKDIEQNVPAGIRNSSENVPRRIGPFTKSPGPLASNAANTNHSERSDETATSALKSERDNKRFGSEVQNSHSTITGDPDKFTAQNAPHVEMARTPASPEIQQALQNIQQNRVALLAGLGLSLDQIASAQQLDLAHSEAIIQALHSSPPNLQAVTQINTQYQASLAGVMGPQALASYQSQMSQLVSKIPNAPNLTGKVPVGRAPTALAQ